MAGKYLGQAGRDGARGDVLHEWIAGSVTTPCAITGSCSQHLSICFSATESHLSKTSQHIPACDTAHSPLTYIVTFQHNVYIHTTPEHHEKRSG